MPEKNPRLRIAGRFTHLVTIEGSVVLVGDDESILLESPLVGEVLRHVDGRLTAIQIAHALEERHRPEMVHFILLSLERGEVIRGVGDGETPSPTPDRTGAQGSSREREIAEGLRAAWLGRGDEDAIQIELPGFERASLVLTLTDDYLHPAMADDEPLSRPRLLAGLGRTRVWLGPYIRPGRTACASCLQQRLRLNLAARTLLHLEDEAASDAFTVERIARQVPAAAYRTLARELLELGRDPDAASEDLADRLRVIPLDRRSPASHAVHRLPQCPSCGDPGLAAPGHEIRLESRPKVAGSGGGYRTVRAEETLARYKSLISPLTGVIRHVRRVPAPGTDLVHVYTASHARHYGTATLRSLKGDRRDPSGGKGRSDLDAHVSAVCESLERFSSVHRGGEPCEVARLAELGDRAIHPNELLLFSEAQYQSRDEWNAADAGGFQWIPEPYEDQPIEWSPVRSLATGETRLIPSSHVYFGFRGEGRRFCKGDSNGLAGGNCLEEAVLQGFLELVERDAVALWWYNRARVPGLDLASSEDPYVESLVEYYPTLGRSLWALDLTTDLGIPCFAALSALDGAPHEDIIFGFGAHLDADIALSRALTEVNQMLPTVFRTPEERRRQLLPEFEDATRWWETATLRAHPYLLPADGRGPSRLGGFPKPRTRDLLDDVGDCVARAQKAGCDVLAHDLTRADLGFVVARIVVPGLRHFWRRLGPGRLYDVPVEIGWIDAPLREEEMNPVSMFV